MDTPHPSPLLLAANQRLLDLRQQQTQKLARPAITPFALGKPNAPLHCRSERDAYGIVVYPDMTAAFLHHNEVPAARVWLLLRYLDANGRGWVEMQMVRERLTKKESALRICGERHMRRILNQGNGRFWQWDGRRVWLNSLVRVADVFDVNALRYKSVEIPLGAITANIKTVKAHFYAVFHSARQKEDKTKPIARDTIEEITSVSPRMQREYEAELGIVGQTNYAVGQQTSSERVQEACWKKGGAVFEFVDYKGLQGPAGKKYVAWQLPNSYRGIHKHKGNRRRKNNARLADLRMKRGAGNGQQSVVIRCYHLQAVNARRCLSRYSGANHYWQSRTPGIWHVLTNPK